MKHKVKPLLLVIEDEPDMRDNYSDLLGPHYGLIFAENGHDAIAEYQRAHTLFKAIILDINLPDMTGHDVIQQFEAISFLEMPPIIVVTAYGDSRDIIKSMTDTQAFFHLTKPFTTKTLFDVLADAVADPYFVRRNFELARDVQLDQMLSQRNSKLLEELRLIKAQMGGFVTLKDVDPYVFHNKGIAKKNLPLTQIIYDLEDDTGIAAPPPPVPKTLIIENEPDMMDILSHVLKGGGHTIYTARDAFTGINILRTIPDLDIVILDLGLPGLNGEEVIGEIKEQLGWTDFNLNDTLSHPDIVVYTGHADHTTITSAIKSGATKYLIKPLPHSTLLQKLYEIQLRRYCLKTLPEMITRLLSQPISYRHQIMRFTEAVRGQAAPIISPALIQEYFPEIPFEKIAKGIPKADLVSDPKAAIDSLRGFSHTPIGTVSPTPAF